MKTITTLQTGIVTLALATTTPVFAGVQFRLSHEASTHEYVVYMTPDSPPSPDLVLSSQVSLSVPHGTDDSRFMIDSIKSAIPGINWVNHSRVDAPAENPSADYLSFGLYYTGSKPPTFGWQADKEMRIFSFTSPTGCVAGIKLLDNSDPFNQMPNSVNTNPGNEFANIGWLEGNAYTGNYGNTVSCGKVTYPPVTTNLTCENNPVKLAAIAQEIRVMSALISKLQRSSQRISLQNKLDELRGLLQCR